MMINLFKLILLLSISIISIESYSIVDADKVKANEAQMIETIKKVEEETLPALKDSLNNYQDNPFISKDFIKEMIQIVEDQVNLTTPLIPEAALEKERDVDDINGMGAIPVISSMNCSGLALKYAPSYGKTICSEYNKSGKTTGYNTLGEVLWCVVEGEYHIPEHCKDPPCGMKKLSSIDLPMPPPDTCPDETLKSYENRIAQELQEGIVVDFDFTELERRVNCHYGQKVLNNNSLGNIMSWMEAILEMGLEQFDQFDQLSELYDKAYLLPMACTLKKCTNVSKCNSIGEQILQHLLATGQDVDFEVIGAEGIEGARDLADFVINKFQ